MNTLTSTAGPPLPATAPVATDRAKAARHERARRRRFALLHALPLPAWQLAFFLGPLLFLLVLSFWTVRDFRIEPAFAWINWERMFGQPHVWQTYARTFGYALLATVLASLIAFPASFAIAFQLSERRRRLCMFLLVIPFFTSYLVRVYAWQIFLSDEGVINALLGALGLGPARMLNTALGTQIGYLTLTLPLVVLIQTMSLLLVDRSQVEAARNLGCAPLRSVFQVVIPAARVGLVVAALFCFIFAFGDFVSPLYLGGGTAPTMSLLIIDTTKAGQQWPRAAVLAVLMIATLMAVALAMTSYAYRGRK